ncbi:MAG: site-specific integrase [Sulfurimonas sp.]
MRENKKIYNIVTIDHPNINNRKISVLFVNNKLDMPSFRFFVREARSGGRDGTVAGLETHRVTAYKIVELYRYLNEFGLDWRTAEEEDIRSIRNGLLCWNSNDELDEDYYDYEPIENDTMNQKLSTWFKFYRFQKEREEQMNMHLSTKEVVVKVSDHYMQHLSNTKSGQNTKIIERWELLVKPSPKKLYYPAINKYEYEAFKTQLKKIDIVYAAIAELMVESGLRVSAALRTEPDFFRNWIIKMNHGGLGMNDLIPMQYINKGGDTKTCQVPLQCIYEISQIYMARPYANRKAKNIDGEYEGMWFTKSGKPVEYHDIRAAFKQASDEMGRGLNNITPHHLRHTFATWCVIDGAKQLGMHLEDINHESAPSIVSILQIRLGHVSLQSTIKYITTAILMNISGSSGPVMSSRTVNRSKAVQNILRQQAQIEYGNDFDLNKFDALEYAKDRGYAVEYLLPFKT